GHKFSSGDHGGGGRPPDPKPQARPRALGIGPGVPSSLGRRPLPWPKGVTMYNDLPPLRPVHHARREIPGSDGCTGVETFARIERFRAALERRLPGASRWIDSWRPHTDIRGVWQPGVVLRKTPRPLTVKDCVAKQNGRVF